MNATAANLAELTGASLAPVLEGEWAWASASTGANILIISSNTGGGHRSAAEALSHSLTRLARDVAVRPIHVGISQILEEAHSSTRRLVELYNYLLRHRQDWVRYYYWFINHFRLSESKILFKACKRYSVRMLEHIRPSVLISVHPMTQHFLAYMLRRLGLQEKIPLYTVVTDPCYGFWRGWACEDVHQYYVASEGARQQLLDYGIHPERIQIAGMPIHQRFRPVSYEERRSIRQQFGWDPDRFTLFLNAGWVGGGHIPSIFEALVRSGETLENLQIVFLAGRNEALLEQVSQIAALAACPVHVLGYRSDLNRLMNASDLMVSKLGGLTTFEALASHLPIIADVTRPPMPQEAHTARFLAECGAGILLDRPDRIVPVVQSLIQSPEQYRAMCEAAARAGRHGASDRIARDILDRLPA